MPTSSFTGKLLCAIENRAVRRVGESFERESNVRIITSTNENPDQMVQSGKFRKDLFFRLNVASFFIPPLRERQDDILLLCNHYIDHYNMLLNHNISGISDKVLRFFYLYPWDGNIRELKNVIEYSCTIKEYGEITLADIPEYMRMKSLPAETLPIRTKDNAAFHSRNHREYIHPYSPLSSQIEALEKDILDSTLKRNHYSITHTAEELQIARQTLYNKLKKYGLL